MAQLEAVIAYAGRGWPVLPIKCNGKAPLTRHGLKDASAEIEQIHAWAREWPTCNWAVRTGLISGLVVIDCDVKNGGAGRESFRELQLPGTLISRTPSGGWHAYYAYADSVIKNRTAFLPGIDVRGENGYVLVPPSVINDQPYYWAMDEEPVPLPEHLLEKLRTHRSAMPNDGTTIVEGQRNDYLTRMAGSLRGQGLDQDEMSACLRELNRARCHPPLPEGEVKSITRSIGEHPTPARIDDWPDPTPLPAGLPEVPAFELSLLPDSLRPWCEDLAERMQCPVDYGAVAMMVVSGALIGRKLGIRPKNLDDWTVTPNLWGAAVGRPGFMKSPALAEALRPLRALERLAADEHKEALSMYVQNHSAYKVACKVAEANYKKRLQNNQKAKLDRLPEEPERPPRRRYLINDTTVEKLGELLQDNPNGLLLFRDELTGFLRGLDRSGHEADRAFYLESWNGSGSFTYDRIGRGTVDIENACMSILGGIQPGPLLRYLRVRRTNSVTDDGFLARFQLLTWPDDVGEYQDIDRVPNEKAYQAYRQAVTRIDNRQLTELTNPSFVSFDNAALECFQVYRGELEQRIRAGTEHPLMESHLAKYRSLVPSLALICHALDQRDWNQLVGIEAIERAIRWTFYLEPHARRVYSPAMHPDMDAAQLLLARIKKGQISGSFSYRDVYRHQWTGLSAPEDVRAATATLEEFDWLRSRQELTGGRTRLIFQVNPKCGGA